MGVMIHDPGSRHEHPGTPRHSPSTLPKHTLTQHPAQQGSSGRTTEPGPVSSGRATRISTRARARNSCRGLERSSERATDPKMAAAAVVVGRAMPAAPAMEEHDAQGLNVEITLL
jgi:hypothetical protein